MPKYVKISALKPEDRSKLKGYWSELWGKEFAEALTTDFTPAGKEKEVAAKSDKKKKEGK